MNSNIKGAVYIAVGAASYGVLATFVKLANLDGIGTAGLAFSQYVFGALVLVFLSAFATKNQEKAIAKNVPAREKTKLVLYGTFLGLTSSFYYLSIQYVPVSVGIILLMQTIWMGVLLEFFVARHLIHPMKVIGAVVTLLGTALAAKVFESEIRLDGKGVIYGLLAAASYTGVLFTTGRIALNLPLFIRSKYLVFGGLLMILLFWNVQIIEDISWMVFLKWGSFLGFFGTLLPPILFNKGMPDIGTGMGSIISSLEIPVSVLSAYWLLNEEISFLQWTGIAIILISVVIINSKSFR